MKKAPKKQSVIIYEDWITTMNFLTKEEILEFMSISLKIMNGEEYEVKNANTNLLLQIAIDTLETNKTNREIRKETLAKNREKNPKVNKDLPTSIPTSIPTSRPTSKPTTIPTTIPTSSMGEMGDGGCEMGDGGCGMNDVNGEMGMDDDWVNEIREIIKEKNKPIPEKPKKIRNITFIPSKPSKPTPITSESILNKLSRI